MTVNKLARPPKNLDSFIGRKWLESITNQQNILSDVALLDFLLVQQDPLNGGALPNARNLEVTSELTINDAGGGGALTLDLSNTAVVPGTYNSVTVNQKGRITGGTVTPIVTSVINTDGSISVSGTTDVTVSIDTSHANVWIAEQSFSQIILDPDDLFTRTLSFDLGTNRITITNPEVGGKTKIHGYNRIELTTNSKSWTLLDTGSSILTFDIDFAGTTNIFENQVTFTSGPLVASYMTASRPVVTDASKNLVSGSVSAPILLTAGAFGLDYNTTNLKLTSSKLNTIQDIATTSSPTFLGLTLGDNSSSPISITFDGSTDSTWTYDPTTASHQILTNGATAFSYPGYDVGVGIIDLDTTGARTALQVWSSGTSGNYPIGFWGGIFDDGSGAVGIIGGIGLNANNFFAGTSARTFSGDIAALAATNEITGSNLTIGSGVQVVGLDVSGTTGAGTVTWGTGRYPVGIRVNNNSLAGADSYGIRLEEQTNGSTNNYEAFFVGGGGAFFRAVGQQVYSSAASTLDLDTTTTGNLRVGGTTEYSWTSTTFTLGDANNIAVGTGTGTKIGTGTTQKLGFYNVTPIAQRSGAAQAAVSTTGSTNVAPFGYTTAAQADAIVTLVNELRAWAVAQGFIKGSA